MIKESDILNEKDIKMLKKDPVEIRDKYYLENENFRVKQGCNFCKNNIQSKINTCRKCKFHDRKNRQSNFVPDPNQKIQSRFKLNQIWNSVFS